MGLLAPPDPAILFPSGALNDAERHFADQYAEIAREDMPLYLDSFGGSYRAARRRLLAAAAANGGNTVILSGDSHNAWAFNLRGSDGEIAAVEIGATSVTSPGFEDELPLPAEAAEHALIAKNPELSYCRLRARGYTVVTISPDAVDVSWIFVDTVKTRNFSAAVGKRLHIPHTSRGGTAALAEA